jgi:Protein of unknown function (DUF2802)
MSQLLSLGSLDLILLAARAAFLVFSFVVAAVAFARWRRAAEREGARTGEQLTQILARLEQIEASLARSEPRLACLAEQLREPPQAATGGSAHYQMAIRLARSGATATELMSGCALSRQEAELVARLHGRVRRSKDIEVAIA